MKSIIIGATILGFVCCASTSWTQEAGAPPPPPGGGLAVVEDQAPDAVPVPKPAPPAGVPGSKNSFGHSVKAARAAAIVTQDAQAEEQFARAQEQLDSAKVAWDVAQTQFERNFAAEPFGEGGLRLWTASTRTEHPLIVRTSETDAKTISAIEQDLNIMGRILEKSLVQTGDDGQPKAMSIPLVTGINRSHPRNFQIEGYGAVFMLNVNFPLAGPASNKSEENAKETSNSAWDQTARELYGPPPGVGAPYGVANVREDYDPKRVEVLKDSIIGALKNASNMHNLKSDESVTVVVSSGGDGAMGAAYRQKFVYLSKSGNVGTAGGGGGSSSNDSAKSPKPETRLRKLDGGGTSTTMTLRAKKSDIDSFANGKLNLEEFRNKVKVLVY